MAAVRWAGIVGEWTFDGDTIRFERPSQGGGLYPYGLAVSSEHLRDGKVHARISLPNNTGAVGAIVIGFRSQRDPYILAQLGAWGAAYAFAAWTPGVGWQRLDYAGTAANLRPDTGYDMTVEVMGQRFRMMIDGVEVLQTLIEAPPAGTIVGLSTTSESAVTFSSFRLTEQKEPTAFVIMPFAEPFDTIYREVILPVAMEGGFKVVRVDEIMAPGIIIDDIQRQIAEAHVVIAEITQPNPNVFYELGYAHALQKPAVLLAQRTDTPLPFDVRSYRAIYYDNTIGGKDKVARALRQHLEAVQRQW